MEEEEEVLLVEVVDVVVVHMHTITSSQEDTEMKAKVVVRGDK